MEGDRLNWGDMDKIDCIHRAHAQRHITPQNSATHYFGKKSRSVGNKNGLILSTFRKVPVSFKVVTDLLVSSIGMCMKSVRVPMPVSLVLKNKIQKTRLTTKVA